MKTGYWFVGLAAAVLVAGACNTGVQTDTDSPVVAITFPMADSTVSGTVSVTAQALDGFGIAEVEFSVDGTVLATDFTAPYSALWNTRTSGDGPHSLRAKATDTSGNTASAAISVTVDNARQ